MIRLELYRNRDITSALQIEYYAARMDAETGAILALQILALCSIVAALLAYLMRQSRNATDEYESRNKRHVLVTSCDTCVGLQIALALYEAGYKVNTRRSSYKAEEIEIFLVHEVEHTFLRERAAVVKIRNCKFAIDCRIGVCWPARPLVPKFTVDENLEGNRAAERKGGGSNEHVSREPARTGSTCSRPNRAIGTGLDERRQFTRLFGCC